jgi:hypothetical protein
MRKETEHCRFLLQNIDGISSKNGYAEVHKIGESAKENSVGILGLAETNIDWHHQGTRNESLQYFSSDFTNWARDVELVDIHVERHELEGNRIDYIQIMKGLTQHVKAAGIS